jgi:hypothetical protein
LLKDRRTGEIKCKLKERKIIGTDTEVNRNKHAPVQSRNDLFGRDKNLFEGDANGIRREGMACEVAADVFGTPPDSKE